MMGIVFKFSDLIGGPIVATIIMDEDEVNIDSDNKTLVKKIRDYINRPREFVIPMGLKLSDLDNYSDPVVAKPIDQVIFFEVAMLEMWNSIDGIYLMKTEEF